MTLPLKDADLTGSPKINGVAFAAAIAPSIAKTVVANAAALLALAAATVQNGDYVFQTDTSALYEVVDQSLLGSSAAFQIFGWLFIESSGAHAAGDLTGNARGNFALDLQSDRSDPSNVASGQYACAVSWDNKAAQNHASAFGNSNEASGNDASAFGYNNLATGAGSSAFGYSNEASGATSSAFGYGAKARGPFSSSAFGYQPWALCSDAGAFGYCTVAAIADVQELGTWAGHSTRKGAVRVHGTGMVALTVVGAASAFTAAAAAIAISGNLTRTLGTTVTVNTTTPHGLDTGSRVTITGTTPADFATTETGIIKINANQFTYANAGANGSTTVAGTLVAAIGSERDGTLAVGMLAFRKNGAALYVDWNDNGTIRTFTL